MPFFDPQSPPSFRGTSFCFPYGLIACSRSVAHLLYHNTCRHLLDIFILGNLRRLFHFLCLALSSYFASYSI
ncbi:hypothetical protein CPB83DRAFT_173568 [Crepidotus variabilis]|uniref:Uncharacterized protein n=1 Tax=Crepidotus variabilis TaxID=179855 RepID=A0A9P6E3D6_9AGAR|nr:hypothetical protein CPB83DRAFT_173568 [Crepidotus variabilis]